MFTVGVFGIIVYDKNHVLLCHRRDFDLWNLPGGKLETGEAPWECVVREIKEETGLETEVVKLAGVYNKPEKNEICFSFVCKIVGGEILLNDEADKVEYFQLNNIPQNTSPNQLERIKDFFEKEEIVFKNQFGKGSIELIREGKL